MPEAEETTNRRSYSESQMRGSLSNDGMTEEDKQDRADQEALHQRRLELREEDYQLSYALDLLQGLSVYSSLDEEN